VLRAATVPKNGTPLPARPHQLQLGVISYEGNQVCVKHSHDEETTYDGRNSKGQRFRFHESEAA
jgi:hypothetical protein